jgi:hypothetical protein
MTVVETAEFLRTASAFMSEAVRTEFVKFIAANPEAGDVIPQTGGVRKIRWGLPGHGKRGGARVIYYYHDERMPTLLLTAYAKNQKENLTAAERNEMKRPRSETKPWIPRLVVGYLRQA